MANFLLNDSFDDLMSQPDYSSLIDISDTEQSETEKITFDLGLDLDDDATPADGNLEPTTKIPTAVDLESSKENKHRFPNLVPDELDGIAKMCSEKSTHYQTKWAVKLFRGQ